MKSNSYVKFFTCCKIVKGYKRSIVYDLPRNEYCFIPNSLSDIFLSDHAFTINDVKGQYAKEDHPAIENIFSQLLKNEFIFLVSDKELQAFPEMDLTWDVPNLLENFILDIDKNSNHDYPLIIDSLSSLDLKIIQLRIFYDMNIEVLSRLIDMITNSNIKSIDIIIQQKQDQTYNKDIWYQFIENYHKIINITIYNSSFSGIEQYKQTTIYLTKENFASCNDCGLIAKENFTCNFQLFTESQKFNSCLNRKASIDSNGNIKNCPSMDNSFGNHKDVSIEDLIKRSEFQKYWLITKEFIEVCKDCEFRFMCVDCRAYVKRKNDIYSQPLKCTYNPYIAKWEGEEGYKSIESQS